MATEQMLARIRSTGGAARRGQDDSGACSWRRHRRPARGRRARRAERAGTDLLGQPPDVGAAAQRPALERAGSIGPPGSTTAGRSTEAAAISSAGDGLVAATEQHHAVDRVGPAASPRWPSRPCCARASRSAGRWSRPARRRQIQRYAARRPHALLHALRHLVEVRVARVRSDAVLAIAICGRPWNEELGVPRRIQARWM